MLAGTFTQALATHTQGQGTFALVEPGVKMNQSTLHSKT